MYNKVEYEFKIKCQKFHLKVLIDKNNQIMKI